MRESSSSARSSDQLVQPRSSSSPWLVVVVLVPLLLVSFAVFGADFNSSASWFSFSSSSSSTLDPGSVPDDVGSGISEEEHEKVHMEERIRGGAFELSPHDNYSGHSSHISLPPVAAPAPAPEPPETLFKDSNRTNVVSSPRRVRRKDITLEKLEIGLASARAAIREAVQNPNRTLQPDNDYVPQGPTYRNAYAFHRSYLEMEKIFRVYVYNEGEPPLFHDGPCRSIYSSEGRFIYNMDMENPLRTKNPDHAHVFFLPFSVVKMVKFIYTPGSFNIDPLKRTIVDYINVIAGKYPYWNRSLGADHFMLSCHDWGPIASTATSYLYSNSIRVLCNANTSEGFNPLKDASLPEINLKTDQMNRMIGGPSASRRPFLAFFAGGMHGPIRPALIKHWKGKDNDIQVHEYLPKGVSYYDMMKKSKFCICPSGYEVASPRVVEAIYFECVPVVISDHYVLPFSDVLNWKSFSVQVAVKDIPKIKEILMSISSRQYIRMQRRVKIVQRHFVVNSPPKRFDVTHMILHSIWLRRLNVRIHPPED